MQWNNHSREVPEGTHAFLSASSYHWVNYDITKLEEVFRSERAKKEGTELHELAEKCIKKRRKLQGEDTFAQYVNDAVGFKMDPEVVLYYSEFCFGTADSISFKNHPDKKSPFRYFLRIHDLKTGKIPAKFVQLELYSALFFLEYKIKPEETEIELRIYQNDEIKTYMPDPKRIRELMEQIIIFSKHLEKLKIELEG